MTTQKLNDSLSQMLRNPLLAHNKPSPADEQGLSVDNHGTAVQLMDSNQGENENDEPNQVTNYDAAVILLLMPILVSVQFYTAIRTSEQECLPGVPPTLVYLSIGMFAVACYLFRHACRHSNFTFVPFLLLPELLMNVILALVYFGFPMQAFQTLLLSMLWMAVFVVMSSCRIICVGNLEYVERERANKEGFEPLQQV